MSAELGDDLAQAHAFLAEQAPRLVHALRTAAGLEPARDLLIAWLDERRRERRQGLDDCDPLDDARAGECIAVLESLIAPRNEARVGFSTLGLLLDALAGESLDPGFVLEWAHLVGGALGRAGVAKGWLGPRLEARGARPVDFGRLQGRAAGLARSEFLDVLGEEMWRQVKRYPCGLDEDVAERRRHNRAVILEALGGNEVDWADWHWQVEHVFKGGEAAEKLASILPLSAHDLECIARATEHGIPFGITPHYLSLFDFDKDDRSEDAQLREQVIPPPRYIEQMIVHRAERRTFFDFMGEHDTSPLELVTRRYPAVAILKALDTCPQICVYCQRNFEIEGPMEGSGFPQVSTIDAALDWFDAHPTITDILVTGGDPLFHDDDRIEQIMGRMAQMEHVQHVRWGTRAPVTAPMRITERLADILGRFVEPGRRSLDLVTHVETAAEVTPAMAEAVHRLRRRGIGVYNQQVYTLSTSRRFEAVALRVALKRAGIDPYYTFLPKGKDETKDYLVPLARVLQERKEEARLLPGIFRTDEPVSNVPRLGKNHLRASQDRELIGIRADGRRVYIWHPWEKGITHAQPWVHADESIWEYLERLKARGEDPEDYESIWSYY